MIKKSRCCFKRPMLIKDKDRISHPVLCYIEYDMYIMSLAAFKSAIRHAGAVTAVRPDNTAATIYDMITARFCCRLITFFLFVFFGHACTSLLSSIIFSNKYECDVDNALIVEQLHNSSTIFEN